MICKTIDLYKEFCIDRPEGAKGYLDIFVRKTSEELSPNRIRPAMLVMAGGGYQYVSDREAVPVAINYLDIGFNCFVLDYSVAPVTYPAQLIEVGMAMAYIRKNAKELCVDIKHVCAIGFSAGGHLCGMLATMFKEKVLFDVLGKDAKLCRPDAVILSYPVISSGDMAHKDSFMNLTGCKDESVFKKFSLEYNVTSDCPPAFIWSTNQDDCVPCENSLCMALAYRKAGVPMELHIFEPGNHGLSTCDKEVLSENDTVRSWLKLSKKWLINNGFVVTD